MSILTVDQVTELVGQGLTDAEIGMVLGKDRRTVQSFRKSRGIGASRPVGQTNRGRVADPIPLDPATPRPAKTITIAEFLLNKKRAVCPVCQLKEPVKSLVQDAKKKGERTADILEYLQVCHRVTITPREFASHISGRHDP